MPRIRSLKYEYFINEELAQISSEARLLGLGITTLADREGRLEDRPLRIKVLLFPYHEVNVDTLLNELQSAGFLERYVVEGSRYLRIINFLKHQKPHPKEPESSIPPPSEAVEKHGEPGKKMESREMQNSTRASSGRNGSGNGLGDPGSLGSGDLGTLGSGDQQRTSRADKRGTRLPGDFGITNEIRQWAAVNAPHVNVEKALEEFSDYWRAVPGTRGLKLDWPATFRNRLRELEGRAMKNGSARSFKNNTNVDVSLESARKVAAKHAGS